METRIIVETLDDSGLYQRRYLSLEEIRQSVLGTQNYIDLSAARNEETLRLKLESLKAEK